MYVINKKKNAILTDTFKLQQMLFSSWPILIKLIINIICTYIMYRAHYSNRISIKQSISSTTWTIFVRVPFLGQTNCLISKTDYDTDRDTVIVFVTSLYK